MMARGPAPPRTWQAAPPNHVGCLPPDLSEWVPDANNMFRRRRSARALKSYPIHYYQRPCQSVDDQGCAAGASHDCASHQRQGPLEDPDGVHDCAPCGSLDGCSGGGYRSGRGPDGGGGGGGGGGCGSLSLARLATVTPATHCCSNCSTFVKLSSFVRPNAAVALVVTSSHNAANSSPASVGGSSATSSSSSSSSMDEPICAHCPWHPSRL